jgi:starch synthase
VQDGVTGLLVDLDPDDPSTFERELARAINEVATDEERARSMGRAGRARAQRDFGWDAVARRTVEVYEQAMR